MVEESERRRGELVPYHYWGPMWFGRPRGPGSMIREMERMMGEITKDVDYPEWRPIAAAMSRYPAVDVMDQGDKYLVKADLPGLTKEDVDVMVGVGILEISAKKEESIEETGKEGYIRRERGRITYHRRLVLPDDADDESVEAKLEEGVLIVQVSKKPSEAEKKKKVEVK